jgi:hypothetical protein
VVCGHGVRVDIGVRARLLAAGRQLPSRAGRTADRASRHGRVARRGGEGAHEVERTERFELRFADDARNLAAKHAEGSSRVRRQTLERGAFLFNLVRGSERSEMSPEEFNQFLDREGIVGQRAQRDPQRKRYWSFLKLLGRSGADNETDLHHRFTGAQFEIVLLQNPFTLQLGEEEIVQLLFDTKPLAGATVFALHRGADGALTKLGAVTDAHGVVRFNLDQRGMWLIRSVHLRPCKDCKDADWESFRAAYSFALE